MRRSRASPSPGAPSASAGVLSKAMRACERLGSMVSTAVAGDAGRLQIDDGEDGAALALGDHDGDVRDIPIRHRQLLAAEGAAAEGGAQLAHIGLAGTFSQRQRADRLAGGQLRQPGLLLRLAAGGDDGLAGEIDRGGERHRRQRRAQLLGQHAQAQMAEAGAAVLFGDRRADPAHGGDLLPQRLVVGLGPFQNAPHGCRRTALAQEFAGLLAQLFQVVAEVEVHRRRSTLRRIHPGFWLARRARVMRSAPA